MPSILAAFKKVLEGGAYIKDSLQKILAESKQENETTNPFDKLSEREFEIALLINKGHTLPGICSLLHIQCSTANNYKRRLFEKLNVYTIAGLSHLMHTFKSRRIEQVSIYLFTALKPLFPLSGYTSP